MKLWESGNISHRTMLEAHGIDVEMEYDRMKQEQEAGYNDVFVKPGTKTQATETTSDDETNSRGRPAMDDSERESDEGNARTGAQPKPSNPEGSEQQEA